MRRFLAALFGGAAGCLAAILLCNHWRDLTAITASDINNNALVAAALTLLTLGLTYAGRRRPANLGAHMLVSTVTLVLLFLAPVLVYFGEVAFLELSVMGAYGYAAGLIGGLSARYVQRSATDKFESKSLIAATVLVVTLTILGQVFPPKLPQSANVTQVVTGNFEHEVLASELPVVVEFSAPWCGPCRDMAKKLDKLAIKLKGQVRFVSVDVDQSPELKEKYHVESLPTVLMFDRGELKRGMYKNLPYKDVEEFFSP